MTRQDIIIQLTGCIRANSDVAYRIMTGQQTQHRVLAKSKNNPFRVGEIYWIREPGRVQSPIKHTDSPLWGWSTIRYTDDVGISIRVPERMRESRWFLESQGIPNGIFKEAARTFVRINRAWREPVQNASPEDMVANGAVVNCKKYDLKSPHCKLCISFDFGSMFEKIKTNSWICNEDVYACEFEVVEMTE